MTAVLWRMRIGYALSAASALYVWLYVARLFWTSDDLGMFWLIWGRVTWIVVGMLGLLPFLGFLGWTFTPKFVVELRTQLHAVVEGEDTGSR